MHLTADARDYTYLYSNSCAFTVTGGSCAVSDRMQELCCFRKGKMPVQVFTAWSKHHNMLEVHLGAFRHFVKCVGTSRVQTNASCTLSQICACTPWNRFIWNSLINAIKYYRKKWKFIRLKRNYVYTVHYCPLALACSLNDVTTISPQFLTRAR